MGNVKLYDAGGDGGTALPAETPYTNVSESNAACCLRLSELEQELMRQHRQLSQAIGYLHEAARLAQYHQPALERHIRTFLSELRP
ncbi:MAG TPA: hypothetical protein VFG50_15910 [Rhodothermales bacterium]|nr:hypothetical protein [Rhodothermales bacterium]